MTTPKDIIFIHVPKTAGSTIYKNFNLTRIEKHTTLNYAQLNYPEHFKKDTYIMGSVRNPWQRAVSLYNWTKNYITPKHRHNLTWKKWLYQEDKKMIHDDIHYVDVLNKDPLKQVNYFINKDGEVQYDEIIRCEHLIADVLKSPVLESKPLRNENVLGTGKDYQGYYDDEDIEYIREKSKWEIEEFGYEF